MGNGDFEFSVDPTKTNSAHAHNRDRVPLIVGTLRTDNAVVWKTRGPRVGLGRAPRTKRGRYVVKIKNATI